MNAESPTATTSPGWTQGRFSRWIFATDHKVIGGLWLAVGGFGVFLGGLLAVISAIQTARPNADVIGQGTYASVVSMQGTLLTYGGVLPLALGLAVVILPLQLGARGIAMPSLTAVAFWLGLAGVLAVVLSSFASGDSPRSSWTTNPGAALDSSRPGETSHVLGLGLIALATLLTAIALLATLRGERAPGLTRERLPLFAQSVGVFAAAEIVVSIVALVGNVLLILARKNPGSFDWYVDGNGRLDPGYGWVFSQAIVAVTLVVALGIAAELITTFSRAELGSRRLVSLALIGTGVFVAIVPSADTVDDRRWASALALIAVIPIAAAAAALLLVGLRAARSEGGATPLPFALGSLVLALVAVLASVVQVISHSDLRGTTFAAARLDLIWASILLGLFGGVVYWWPKLTGRVVDAKMTNLTAAVVTGSALLLGIGRAIAGWNDQPGNTGVTINGAGAGSLIGAIGVFGIAVGILLFGLAKAKAKSGRRVGNDPWRADTLEWWTTSPPPLHNFDSLPPVESSRPVHDARRAVDQRDAR